MLVGMPQDIVNETNLMRFMHTPTLYNGMTVYSTVMVPGTGYYKTSLPDEPPLPKEGFAAARGGSGALGDMSAEQQKKRKFLYKSLGKLATDFQKGGTEAAMADFGPLQAYLAEAKKQKQMQKTSSASSAKEKVKKAAADTQEKSGCRGVSSAFSFFAIMGMSLLSA